MENRIYEKPWVSKKKNTFSLNLADVEIHMKANLKKTWGWSYEQFLSELSFERSSAFKTYEQSKCILQQLVKPDKFYCDCQHLPTPHLLWNTLQQTLQPGLYMKSVHIQRDVLYTL